MPSFGPIYCETGHAWLFMAEPVNTITNAAIILAAILASRAIRKLGTGNSYDLYLLTIVLFINGIGSFLWHGFRTPLALTFDVAPGIVFLFLFTYLWMRKLYGVIPGFLGLLTLIGSVWFSTSFIRNTELPFLLPIFGSVLVVGIGFALLTYKRLGKDFALRGSTVLLVALAAAFFRTIDLSACSVIPFGTHFLWHFLLSTAAYLGIVFLIKLDKQI